MVTLVWCAGTGEIMNVYCSYVTWEYIDRFYESHRWLSNNGDDPPWECPGSAGTPTIYYIWSL